MDGLLLTTVDDGEQAMRVRAACNRAVRDAQARAG